MNLVSLDKKMLAVFQRASLPLMRMAIAIVYGWFGILKVFGMTPADQLVSALQVRTLSFIPEQTFLMALGLFEVVVAVIFLIPKFTRLAILLLVLHMIATLLPLVFLPDLTWSGFLQPTLIGQYILKNVIILALAMAIGVQLKPLKTR